MFRRNLLVSILGICLAFAGCKKDESSAEGAWHGATTTGQSVEDAVTSMLHLEHQAQMNYYACALGGMDHAYVPDAL